MGTRSKLKLSVLAVCLAGMSVTAWGGLGRMQVQSGLGQPLRAEVEITDTGNAPADAFTARIASPETHRDLAADYAGYLSQLRLTVEKRANGRAVVRISSTAPINEPFVSMVVELNGPTGKTYRKLTALLDPSGYAAPPRRNAKPEQPPAPASPPAPATPAEPRATEPARSTPPAAVTLPGTYRIRPGDSLSRLATRLRPAGSSPAQSMLALYRANPSAFIAGNPNALIAGQTLTVPSAETAKAVSRAEAADTVKKWQGDWRQHALNAADAASKAPPAAATADTGKGKIAAPPTSAAESDDQLVKDVLRLSRASDKTLDGKDRLAQLEEEAVMREQTLKNANARIVELEKQLAELKSKPASGGPAVSPPPKKAVVADTGSQDLVVYGAGGLAALLLAGGIGGWVGSRRRAAGTRELAEPVLAEPAPEAVEPPPPAAPEPEALEPEPEPLAPPAVDPLVEAERLIAAGREGEAETVLSDALDDAPQRQDLRLKLLELLAARQEVMAFNGEAAVLHEQTGGSGDDWGRIAALGRELDSDNPLYQPVEAAADAGAEAPEPVVEPADADVAEDELDIELLAAAASRAAASTPAAPIEDDFLAMLGEPAVPAPPPEPAEPEPEPVPVVAPPAPVQPPPVAEEDPDRLLDFDFQLEEIDKPKPAAAAPVPATDDLSFDLDAALLDADGNDPVSTKLDLAQVYFDMGDAEGAREILDEVMTSGSDTQQARAQELLAKL